MIRFVIVLAIVLSSAVGVRAEEVALPTDPRVRTDVQIAACDAGDPAMCLEVAAELGRRGVSTRRGHSPASLRARATSLLDEQCSAAKGDACFEYGRLLVNRGDAKTGMPKIERACELGSGLACTFLASRAKGRRRTSELLERACTFKDAHACESVAQQLERKDPARAVELHRKACSLDDAAACIESGEQRQRSGDIAGAFTDFESACDLRLAARGTAKDVAVCDVAGQLASDATKARALFESACTAGAPTACIHLGERIARGIGGERNWGAGIALVKDGCKRSHDGRCRALGVLEKQRPDWACNTHDECVKHCEEQLWPACRRVVELEGPDDLDAERWLVPACDGGDAISCRLLGDLELSFTDALPRYRSACKQHDAAACTYVRLDRARHGSAADVAALRASCKRDQAACALYGLAIARKDQKRARTVWREACDHGVGVACRYLASSFDPSRGSAPDAMSELVLYTSKDTGYGICGCDDAPAITHKEADDWNRRYDEAERLLLLGCAAGDVKSCEAPENLPAERVSIPAWE